MTLKGPTAGVYYLNELPRYYLDADGEPPGRWHGHAAEMLGIDVRIVDGDFLAVMAGRDPTTNRDLGRVYGTESVRGFDVTASAPKSVSVLWALGDEHTRAVVVDAHDTAVGAMIDWIESHAHTRYRIGGSVAVVDAEGILAGVFRQHTSRALDPQLHSHVVVANRVLSDDGRWLALDARTLKLDQRTLSAIYHASLRAELTNRLGVAWLIPENGIAEIAGMPAALLAEYSARTTQVRERVAEKLARFEATMGREPTGRERWRLEREAVVDSRPTKPKPLSAERLHDQWRARAVTLGVRPEHLVDAVTSAVDPTRMTSAVTEQMMVDALAALADKQSSWRPAEIVRQLAAATPTDLDIEADELVAVIDQLAARIVTEYCIELSAAIPDNARLRRDGRPVTESAVDRALTTHAILVEEAGVLDWAQRRAPNPEPAAPIPTPEHLSGPQREVAAAIAGTDALVLVVGPAGTGKTTAIKPAVDHLRSTGRVVFGVAPSAVAAEVLATETGVDADTLDKLLIEHTLKRPPLKRFDLPRDATVIVDEAAMVSTPKLGELARLADQKQWRVVLVGDPLQFSPVGRGGMFTALCDRHPVIELDTVHRFANPWERQASLALRRSDPDALAVYDRHHRIHALKPEHGIDTIIYVWHTRRAEGGDVLLMAASNTTVVELNRAAQQQLIRDGDINTNRFVDTGVYRLHVGDRIVTRRNDRDLTTTRGRHVHNRDEWTITTIARGGAVTVDCVNGRVTLPGAYVGEHVELAYAQTSHAAQGRTVDHALLYIDGPTDTAGVYVPLTRGRETNNAYVVVTDNQTAVDVLEAALAQRWIDTPAHTRHQQLNPTPPAPPTPTPTPTPTRRELSGPDLRGLLAQRSYLEQRIGWHDMQLRHLPPRLETATKQHDQLVVELANLNTRSVDAKDVLDRYDRPLHRRGHTQQIAHAHHHLGSAQHHAPYLERHIAEHAADIATITAELDKHRKEAPSRGAWLQDLADTTTTLNDDLNHRARRHRQHPTGDLTRVYGERPTNPETARRWDTATALSTQHNDAYHDTSGHSIERSDNRRRVQHANEQLEAAIEHDNPHTRGRGHGISM